MLLLQEARGEGVYLYEGGVLPELHLTSGGGSSGDVWYLDNGASNHMTGDLEKFRTLDEKITGKVRFGDDSTVEIKGKGTILFQCKSGDQWALTEVFFIPKLRSNLISLGQLTETGHKVVLDDEMLDVFEKNPFRLIMKVDRTLNRMYKIELKIAAPVCFLASISDEAWLWHGRLGHTNFHSLKLLSKKKMAEGVPTISHPDQLCRACLSTKQPRSSYPKVANWRAQKKLELVHVDLCGPISPSTAGGNRYFMLLIDDYTRWSYVYVLQTKDQALDAFVKFKAETENVTGERIKALRSDRGGEFLAAAFREVCEKAGIQRHLTAPYSP